MNKKKLVFWRKFMNDPVLDGFLRNPEYHAFFQKCNEAFDFRFSYNSESYAGKGVFRNVFKYELGRIIPAEPEFAADVIYQFKRVANKDFDNAVPIVNTNEFKSWCGDKWQQYQVLKDFMPKTFLVEEEEDFEKSLSQISTAKAVIKPRRGQKGEGVVVFEKQVPPILDSEILATKGYLLQEFSDTSMGIPSIVVGVHDLKLITIDNSIFANLRTPEQGDVCTFDSPYTEVLITQLPKEIIALHKKVKTIVDTNFSGQFYTVDVGYTEQGPVVFELNGHTAFPYISFEYAQDFFDALIRHLSSL